MFMQKEANNKKSQELMDQIEKIKEENKRMLESPIIKQELKIRDDKI